MQGQIAHRPQPGWSQLTHLLWDLNHEQLKDKPTHHGGQQPPGTAPNRVRTQPHGKGSPDSRAGGAARTPGDHALSRAMKYFHLPKGLVSIQHPALGHNYTGNLPQALLSSADPSRRQPQPEALQQGTVRPLPKRLLPAESEQEGQPRREQGKSHPAWCGASQLPTHHTDSLAFLPLDRRRHGQHQTQVPRTPTSE